MQQVVDTIRMTRKIIEYHSILSKYDEGCIAVLDPQYMPEIMYIDGQEVIINTPSGEEFSLSITLVNINPGGVIGLFFKDLNCAAIPRGSWVRVSDGG